MKQKMRNFAKTMSVAAVFCLFWWIFWKILHFSFALFFLAKCSHCFFAKFMHLFAKFSHFLFCENFAFITKQIEVKFCKKAKICASERNAKIFLFCWKSYFGLELNQQLLKLSLYCTLYLNYESKEVSTIYKKIRI